MIKCDVNLCAVISKAAVVKTSKEGASFLSFIVKLFVQGRDNFCKELELSVTTDGDKGMASVYAAGRRVSLKGSMYVKSKDGKTYYNVRADGPITMANSHDSDLLEGTMEFRGKTDPKKPVDERHDKNGKLFKAFSGFSSDKDGEKTDFTWVRFLYFDPKEGEDFLKQGAYLDIKGDLQLSAYQKSVEGGVKSGISLECRVKEISPWQLPS